MIGRKAVIHMLQHQTLSGPSRDPTRKASTAFTTHHTRISEQSHPDGAQTSGRNMNQLGVFNPGELGVWTQMAMCVCGDNSAQCLRERLRGLTGSLQITLLPITQPGKEEKKKSLLPQFPHWPNEDHNATCCTGLFSTLSEMINVDTHCLAPSKYLINVDSQ